ncbi:MAG: BamA/TamA family outer membrane protein [Balneolaceae bacterium]
MKETLVLFVIILLSLPSAADLNAQGFQLVNERNHPWIDWKVSETAHFRIIYPEHLSGIEAEVASIAEESYAILSENFHYRFKEKIRIYLTDTDDITNGMAANIGNGYIQIWVHSNLYAETFTGSAKWLRTVISHELAHLFHFGVTRTGIGLWSYLLGNPTPRFWTEGLAQYQSEQWNSQRGDRWLRTAIFDGRPDYNDHQSIYNPLLMYASGHSQARYFAETHGDSLLGELLRGRNSIAGVIRYHDLESSFEQTTGTTLKAFQEEWRRDMNTYYHTLAAQMDRIDSLGSEPLSLPGDYFADVKLSPDGSRFAALSIPSVQRPVRQLLLVDHDSLQATRAIASGHIRNGISWHPESRSVAYSRLVRGEKSRLLNDIFVNDLETGKEEQITYSRRALFPVFGPAGNRIAYIASEGNSSNLFILDLETDEETQITDYGDHVQLIHLAWNHPRNELIFQRFDASGNRHLVLHNPETGAERVLDPAEGNTDNRQPVVSPDGNQIAFTSLRDDVPNIFITDLDSGSTRRVTWLFTGAEAYDWIPAGDSLKEGMLLLKATETKRREQLYLIDAATSRNPEALSLPDGYSRWRDRQPPRTIPLQIPPRESLVESTENYNGWKNLTHLASLALPYYNGRDQWGVLGLTGWVDPLGRHLLTGAGSLSFGDPAKSYGLFNYTNNRFRPTLSLTLYRAPWRGRFYESNYIVDQYTGGQVAVSWPIDRFESDYRKSHWGVRVRYASIEPFSIGSYSHSVRFEDPASARQMDMKLSWTLKQQKPGRQNLIHPLDGYGIRASVTGADRLFGSDIRSITTDTKFYTILPAPFQHRFFLSLRYQGRFGDALPQNYIGFSKTDNIQIELPTTLQLFRLIEQDRVRGYRELITGRHVAFATVEYRIPFLRSLNTTILGFLRFGSATLSLFTDAGVVWNAHDSDGTHTYRRRLGMGTELKNVISIGPLRFVHSAGIAQPWQTLLQESNADLYYRIKASLPF